MGIHIVKQYPQNKAITKIQAGNWGDCLRDLPDLGATDSMWVGGIQNAEGKGGRAGTRGRTRDTLHPNIYSLPPLPTPFPCKIAYVLSMMVW